MSNVVCDTAKGDQQAAASPSFCKRKVQLLAPNQQGPAAIGSFQLTCLAASLGLLLLGFLYYLSYRDQIPVLLTWLGMRPHGTDTALGPALWQTFKLPTPPSVVFGIELAVHVSFSQNEPITFASAGADFDV